MPTYLDSPPALTGYRRAVPADNDLVTWAEALARETLVGVGDRVRHSAGVAARAAEAAHILPEADRPVLIAAAWLHDIGYAPDAQDTGLHALDGARYLQRLGVDSRVVNLVAHHSGARYEAAFRRMADLTEFPLEDGRAMDVLVWADMTVGPHGDLVSHQRRLGEILVRYPGNHPVHQAVVDGRSYLDRCVSQVDSLLGMFRTEPVS